MRLISFQWNAMASTSKGSDLPLSKESVAPLEVRKLHNLHIAYHAICDLSHVVMIVYSNYRNTIAPFSTEIINLHHQFVKKKCFFYVLLMCSYPVSLKLIIIFSSEHFYEWINAICATLRGRATRKAIRRWWWASCLNVSSWIIDHISKISSGRYKKEMRRRKSKHKKACKTSFYTPTRVISKQFYLMNETTSTTLKRFNALIMSR